MRGVVLIPLLLVAATAWAGEPATDPLAALTEGNRLFRNGQLEAAVEAYRAGYTPEAPHPTLAYNLGTALHHLDRLPEAILWYRRAGDSSDPWLADNLRLARQRLGTRELPPGGPAAVLARHPDALRWLAVLLAWVTLAAIVFRPTPPPWALAAALVTCVALYGAAGAFERWGPRPAVLLEACPSPAGELPAGTEAWVRPRDDGGFQVAGSAAVCPAETVAFTSP